MPSPILQPVVALVLWSLVMWVWLYATRIPAMQAAKVPLNPNATAAEFNANIPPNVRWKADNYNHLMEQPTIFYAVALAVAVAGHGDGLNAWLAWGYVGLRVAHSLVQATVNAIMVRFSIFMLSSIVLAMLAIHAAMGLF
ncbi:MAPEG family protein [Phenylobacterium sp.]|uniref:MAPEG family protein n=1 Tax=Phenylobacterium sp. TaxID=1871053 RepID=UPI0025CC62DD|nr:MAPEG family protein [Phenylobacterium sp.]